MMHSHIDDMRGQQEARGTSQRKKKQKQLVCKIHHTRAPQHKHTHPMVVLFDDTTAALEITTVTLHHAPHMQRTCGIIMTARLISSTAMAKRLAGKVAVVTASTDGCVACQWDSCCLLARAV